MGWNWNQRRQVGQREALHRKEARGREEGTSGLLPPLGKSVYDVRIEGGRGKKKTLLVKVLDF